MARRLNIKVIAEYIEKGTSEDDQKIKKEIYESIKYIGCDYGQGYYFGKPKLNLV